MEKYLVKVTLFDGNECYVCKGFFTKYALASNISNGIRFDLEEGNAVSQEFKKYYPEYEAQLSKVNYEKEGFWHWDKAWDVERAADNLFNFLNYKIKYFPDETFYAWYVYVDYRRRCLLVEQKVEEISKGFYHVYENDVVSVTGEKK